MSRVRVNIGRLVLNGFDAGQQRALVGGLKSELLRILADPAARAEWAVSHRIPVLNLGRVPLELGVSGGRRFGARLAAAVGKGLKP